MVLEEERFGGDRLVLCPVCIPFRVSVSLYSLKKTQETLLSPTPSPGTIFPVRKVKSLKKGNKLVEGSITSAKRQHNSIKEEELKTKMRTKERKAKGEEDPLE